MLPNNAPCFHFKYNVLLAEMYVEPENSQPSALKPAQAGTASHSTAIDATSRVIV